MLLQNYLMILIIVLSIYKAIFKIAIIQLTTLKNTYKAMHNIATIQLKTSHTIMYYDFHSHKGIPLMILASTMSALI